MNSAPANAAPSTAYRLLRPWVAVEASELKGLLSAFGCALTMFAAYSILRPVRDAMGITSGLSSLPALFWGSFAVMLVAQPIFGALISRYRRAIILPRIYAFFALMLLGFFTWFHLQEDHTWIARFYFVWVSVFNLFVVAVFWSLMADVFHREQAGRLFGFIAGGISLGGLTGSFLAGWVAQPLGAINLLLISVVLLLTSAVLMRRVIGWDAQQETVTASGRDSEVALSGGAWSAFVQVARSPYLLGIAVFVLLLTSASTVVYVELQRVVGAAIAGADARTALFGKLDFGVQIGALIGQMLLFSRLLRRFGFVAVLVSVPLLMVIAFAALGIAGSLQVVLGVTLVRRIGEFALVRPCRDMLFTVLTREEKYKAKNLLDTFVYRGGDALSVSAYAGIVALSAAPSVIGGICGAVVALVWAAVAVWLGRRFEQAGRGDRSKPVANNAPAISST